MHYHHLYADEDGESHWRDVDVVSEPLAFAPPAKDIYVSVSEPATHTMFLRLPVGWDEPRHASPRAQYLVVRFGMVEVTASDGEVRVIGPGDVWRMDDTHGKGHHTRVLGEVDFDALVVQLPE